MNTTKNISIFGCGGSSIKALRELRHPITFIDTSDSEQGMVQDQDSLHIISLPHGGGSGGNSGTNIKEITMQMPALLDKCKLSDINVISFSASGGSGRAIGYMVAEQAIQQGLSVILFVSVSPSDLNRSKNSSKTLIGLNQLANKYGVSLPIHIYETNDSFVESNQEQVKDIASLLGVFGAGVTSIDYKDRLHALNPILLDGYSSCGLLAGSICFGDFDSEKNSPPVVCVTLALDGESDNIGSGATFIVSGLLPEGFKTDDTLVETVSILYTRGPVARLIMKLNNIVDDLNKINDNRALEDASLEFKLPDSMVKNDPSLGNDEDGGGFII